MKHDFGGLVEADVRALFKKKWDGWMDTFEFAMGATVGVCDTQILARPAHLVPIELKRGVIIDKRLYADLIRPGQVRWHTMFAAAGGKSWFIIGAMCGKQIKLFSVQAMIVLATRETGLLVTGCSACHELLVDEKCRGADATFSHDLRAQLT